MLIQIINSLPKLHSLSLHQTKDLLCADQLLILCSTRLTSEITKIYLEKMNQIQEIYFLMILCSSMTYLIVDLLKLFLQTIFNKINRT
jgi:hypothetical protein